MERFLLDLLGAVPAWFKILFISMIPFVELRGAIPVAMAYYHWPWYTAYGFCVAGNLLPVPFILLFLHRVEHWLRRYPLWDRIMNRLFSQTRRKATSKIERYEELGLILFVAIPLPVTGAWTGSLVAYLFDLDIKKAFACIALGVLIAGTILVVLMLVSWVLAAFMVAILIVGAIIVARL